MCCLIVDDRFYLSPLTEMRGGSSLSTLTEGILGRRAHSLAAAGHGVDGLELLGLATPRQTESKLQV